MYNKSDNQLITMKDLVYSNKQDTDDLKKKLRKHDSEFTNIKSEFTEIKKILKQIML